jgi:hypothetical protein
MSLNKEYFNVNIEDSPQLLLLDPKRPPPPSFAQKQDCRSCDGYACCGIQKNDPFYSCERCVAKIAQRLRRANNPLGNLSYQTCAINCHCRD